jgi:hypothetical protein
MYQRFRSRAPFDRWQDQVLRDYCYYALRSVPHKTLKTRSTSPTWPGLVGFLSNADSDQVGSIQAFSRAIRDYTSATEPRSNHLTI